MKNKSLIKTIEEKLKEFTKEYKIISKEFFGKNSTFSDVVVDRGAFLEQRIDDLNNILEHLKKKKDLLVYHFDMLKRAGVVYNE